MKQFFEWYLGIPPSADGQGTAWKYDWRSPWPHWLPPWGVLLLLLAVVAYVAWVYYRDARTQSLLTRLSLTGLRLAAIALVLVFLSELTLSVDRTGLPTLVVLIDTSESMQFEDDYSGDELRSAVRQLSDFAASAEPATPVTSAPQRLMLTKALLLQEDGAWLKALLRRHKLRVYTIGESATQLGDGELLNAADVDALLPLIAELKADGPATRLGPAVQKVLEELRGAPPSAVIVFSDGITSTNEAEALTSVVSIARDKLVPVFTVGLGTEEPAQDVQVYGLLADDVAFVSDPVPFSVKVKSFGVEGQPLTVRLVQRDTQKTVATTDIIGGVDGTAQKAELVWTPTEKGEFEFVAEITPLADETNPHNNTSQPQTVSVRQDPIRVLLVDSAARYEFRYLKHMLEREAFREGGQKTLELDTVLQDADLEYVDSDRTAIARFPVRRDELFQYDVVIFGDVDLAFLSPAVIENLRDFVREAGGGLMMIAGERFNPLGYRGTLLEDMLPVELLAARAPAPNTGTIVDPFQPELTPAGRQSNTVFRFRETTLESQNVWNSLPPLYWFIETPTLKPGAVVFAQHPYRTGEDGNLPLIAVQQFGAGKVWYHATDELWRWRFRRGDSEYGRYWLQAIRYLTRTRLLGQDRGAKLTADREQYQRGDTVTLRVRFLDDRLAPPAGGKVTVMLERRGDAQRKVELSRLPQSTDIFEGQVPRIGEGAYHVWVVDPTFTDAPPSDDFLVESLSRELAVRNMNKEELLQTAKQTGGKYFNIATALGMADDLPPGQPVPLESQDPVLLWNRWELLLLFTLVLTTEWLWRKRLRLV